MPFVTIRVTDNGHKELLDLESGYRESELSWKALLLRLKDQGLAQAPQLAIGNRALGFWKALLQVFPITKKQCCWVVAKKRPLQHRRLLRSLADAAAQIAC